jgi:hypothetical protein
MKKFDTYLGAGLIALFSPSFLACSEIEDGYNDIDSWPDVVDYTSTLQHPCMLHTEADFQFVKEKVDAGLQPWKNAYDHLCQSQHSQNTWTASPVEKLARLDQKNWSDKYPNDWNNYTHLMRDAASAYQLALRWKISGDDSYAKAGVDILNAWAKKCTGYIVGSDGKFIDPNENLIAIQIHQLANAAEVLRTYKGWNEADFTKYKAWMKDVFYPFATNFLSTHEGRACALHYWLNWDLANMTAILSIGILNDDNFLINEAIQYFKYGIGSGNIVNGVPFVHQDPDSEELLGQCQESGRDQGHATLCVSLMGVFCQMAKNIGEDLFAYDNYRALAMCEYIAKYNYGTTETGSASASWNLSNFKYDVSSLPYTTYENCEGGVWPSMSYEEHKNGNETRGSVRPAWELFYRYALDNNRPARYAKEWVELMRQNASRGNSDGGAGDYGPNSGGYDQLGFGTLMFAKE